MPVSRSASSWISRSISTFGRTAPRDLRFFVRNVGDPIAFVERHVNEGLSDFFRLQAEEACADLVLDVTLRERELAIAEYKAIQNHFSEG